MNCEITRRQFLKASGALVVAFGLPVDVQAQTASALRTSGGPLPPNQLDSWLIIQKDGMITVMTGKVELGTGVSTSLRQIVADELDYSFEKIIWIQGDTANTVDQAPTFGSQTIKRGGSQLRQAAAEAKATLLLLASNRLGVPIEALTIAHGVISTNSNAKKKVTYAELLGGLSFNREVTGKIKTKSPGEYKLVGKSVPRVDIPMKVTGEHIYLQNLRIPGMLHGRVIRPSSVGAKLTRVDEASIKEIPGLVKVVTKGNFVGVVCEREEQTIRAAHELKVAWQEAQALPAMSELSDVLKTIPSDDRSPANVGDVEAAFGGAAKTLKVSYHWPYQLHASMGPSCAIADVKSNEATIWSATQGAHQLRPTIAQLLGLSPANVRVVYIEAAGCYGHNAADDAAADAALLSQAVEKPVRVQWMRADEHAWEPLGPAMVLEVRGGLDHQGNVVAWDFNGWTPTHSGRPNGSAGSLLAGSLVGMSAGKPNLSGAERNANHTYNFKNNRVMVHWLNSSPLRASALRGLGSPQNTFANESFMDELATAAGVDPVEFRLRHINDARARAVLEAVAKRAGWSNRPSPQAGSIKSGRGVAFVQYDRTEAYVAAVADVDVNPADGEVRVKRVTVAHDCGLIINPDGLRNQIEGNVIQAMSRALKEEVKFDRSVVTSLDWTLYPILRFPEIPEVIIELINRPDQPAVGAGEATTSAIAPAIANAIFNATSVRLRTIPFTPERVKAALT
ncbi:MAG TPA: molybdopterin cofactor-binding domain-containing protein [Candidatus Binatia bacterium]|jgi:CO/xanthine dehydrogenase Mo-binding subunit